MRLMGAIDRMRGISRNIAGISGGRLFGRSGLSSGERRAILVSGMSNCLARRVEAFNEKYGGELQELLMLYRDYVRKCGVGGHVERLVSSGGDSGFWLLHFPRVNPYMQRDAYALVAYCRNPSRKTNAALAFCDDGMRLFGCMLNETSAERWGDAADLLRKAEATEIEFMGFTMRMSLDEKLDWMERMAEPMELLEKGYEGFRDKVLDEMEKDVNEAS